ncbi:MAG: hypothetical protein J7500_05410 [Sphingomonas sp.]|uniref:head-tail connector protein n=1 Tax=Sphingomonas sp. TaxID=28214 RepID=UPI001B29F4D5|nr:hypothetical protein [Sphingomonas sp.]MBO9622132.1 hypothetical protein [Sphingomonas sp.]
MVSPPFDEAALAAARDAAKAHLRISGESEDTLLVRHAATALALCEAFTGCALLVREWSDMVPADRCWQRLAGAPATAIASVEGVATEGAGFALPVDAYAVDIDANGEGWVRVMQPGGAGHVRVTYSAGLAASWEALPAPIAQGAVLLIAHLFEARAQGGAPPAAVAALWRPWRRMRLGESRVA